jgi:hypothetical protein
MTIQTFALYTQNGFAGDLVDSGPRVVQTGILTGAAVGFGKAIKRDATVERGVTVGGAARVFAISQREYNHEALSTPSDGTDFGYQVTESVSTIRQGYLYLAITDTAVSTLAPLSVDTVTGEFAGGGITTGNFVVTTNVFPDELGAVGDVIKCRIDI